MIKYSNYLHQASVRWVVRCHLFPILNYLHHKPYRRKSENYFWIIGCTYNKIYLENLLWIISKIQIYFFGFWFLRLFYQKTEKVWTNADNTFVYLKFLNFFFWNIFTEKFTYENWAVSSNDLNFSPLFLVLVLLKVFGIF